MTSIELAALRRAVDARGGARSWKRASGRAPRARGCRVVDEERACPLLDAAGRCAVYAARPLGCRTFFCDRAEVVAPIRQREVNALVRRIQEIAARHEPDGDRGRPLTKALWRGGGEGGSLGAVEVGAHHFGGLDVRGRVGVVGLVGLAVESSASSSSSSSSSLVVGGRVRTGRRRLPTGPSST